MRNGKTLLSVIAVFIILGGAVSYLYLNTPKTFEDSNIGLRFEYPASLTLVRTEVSYDVTSGKLFWFQENGRKNIDLYVATEEEFTEAKSSATDTTEVVGGMAFSGFVTSNVYVVAIEANDRRFVFEIPIGENLGYDTTGYTIEETKVIRNKILESLQFFPPDNN